MTVRRESNPLPILKTAHYRLLAFLIRRRAGADSVVRSLRSPEGGRSPLIATPAERAFGRSQTLSQELQRKAKHTYLYAAPLPPSDGPELLIVAQPVLDCARDGRMMRNAVRPLMACSLMPTDVVGPTLGSATKRSRRQAGASPGPIRRAFHGFRVPASRRA